MDVRRRSYHHGNARKALIKAAAALLEKSGAAGLSLRQVAERAGLSRQAPYNHFTDKATLLAELVRDGFERLAAGTRIAAASTTVPVRRLSRAAESYITFGQEQPALLRLMFGKEFVDHAQYPDVRAAASTSLTELSEIVANLGIPSTAVPDVALVTQSLVHGYTSLCIEAGLEGPEMRAERAELFAQTIEALAAIQAKRAP